MCAQAKKAIIVIDAVANGLWAFLWFVAFAYLADQWRRTPKNGIGTANYNCANSGVAFSFFSIFIWVRHCWVHTVYSSPDNVNACIGHNDFVLLG